MVGHLEKGISMLIRCMKCGHEIPVTHEFLAKAATCLGQTIPLPPQELNKYKEKLKCDKCKSKDIVIIASTQIASTKPLADSGRKRYGESSKRMRREHASVPSAKSSGIIRLLLSYDSWLFPGEISILQSFLNQVKSGKSLSSRQEATITKICKRLSKRKGPRVVSGGGGPGTGKRR
jgi:DNA-directed RNA polymerase subunit RPC12/RpoP